MKPKNTNRRSTSLILILFTTFSLISGQNLYAQNVDEALRRNIQIQQREQQERQNLERQRDLQEIEQSRKKALEDTPSELSREIVDDGQCRIINQFIILGNKNLKLEKFITSKQGKCLTKTDLKNVKDAIGNYYIEKGYVLARVYFGLQQINQGKVEIIIEEGKVDNLEIKDNSKINDLLTFRRKWQKFFAFGLYGDRVVNLRDIEQGLDQMNRLYSNDAKMDIVPSNKVGENGQVGGYSDIIINNKVQTITKPSFEINNSGNQNTGRTRQNFSLDQDNLIGINDNIYLSHSRSDHNGVDKKYFKSNYAAISIPLTYYTFGGNYSDSKYLTNNKSATTTTSSGASKSSSYYISRVLMRSKKYKISLKAELDNNSNENYLNDIFLDINSRKLTIAKFSLDNVFYTKLGTIFLQPKYNKGTKLMGALKDKKNLDIDEGRAQFDSYGLYGSLTNNFLLPKTDINLTHNLTFDSQISNDRLFPSEQMSIGGRYTVRGFEESSISGDNGYYIKNDLTVNSLQIMPKFLQNRYTDSFFQKLSATIFYDYGYVRNKIINEAQDKGYMSGAGSKLSYKGEGLQLDLTYSKGLHSPQFLRNINHLSEDNESIYLSAKISFDFYLNINVKHP